MSSLSESYSPTCPSSRNPLSLFPVKSKPSSSLSSAYVSSFRAKRGTLSRFLLVQSPSPPDTGAFLHLSRISILLLSPRVLLAQSCSRHMLPPTRMTMEVMARYGGAVGYGSAAAAADVAWKMGRIMLKYRPIAPKPVSGGAVGAAGRVETKSSRGRGKRKGCMKEGRRGRRKNAKIIAAAVAEAEAVAFGEEQEKIKNSNNFSAAPSVITLPLMPVTPERKESSPATPTASGGQVSVSCFGRPASWQQVGTTTASSSNCNSCNISSPSSSSVVVAPGPVGSCITVECVTDMWREGDVQVAPLANAALLERDTCPVFVSDACDRVTWTNAAYKQMVVGPGEEEDGEEKEEGVMRVALVTKGMVPAGATCFTCRVRVRYACKRKGGKVSMAAPCDVWRLADGRLAWRLDVKAALSLSLGS